MMLHTLELGWIHKIQQLCSPFLKPFLVFLDYFDRMEFYFILIPLIWFGCSWRAGLRLFYLLFLSSFINQTLKGFFLSPRPFHIDPSVGMIQISGMGFPSGAAQSVILLSGLLIAYWKNPWRWPVAFCYIFLISFSRVYMGIHFPSDILGGWIVGGGLLAIYFYLQPPLEKYLAKQKPIRLLIFSQLSPLPFLYWQTSPTTLRLSCIAMGMGIGLFAAHLHFQHKKKTKAKRWQIHSPFGGLGAKGFMLRGIIGVLATLICYFMLSFIIPSFVFLRYLILGFWIGLSSLFLKPIFPFR